MLDQIGELIVTKEGCLAARLPENEMEKKVAERKASQAQELANKETDPIAEKFLAKLAALTNSTVNETNSEVMAVLGSNDNLPSS